MQPKVLLNGRWISADEEKFLTGLDANDLHELQHLRQELYFLVQAEAEARSAVEDNRKRQTDLLNKAVRLYQPPKLSIVPKTPADRKRLADTAVERRLRELLDQGIDAAEAIWTVSNEFRGKLIGSSRKATSSPQTTSGHVAANKEDRS